MHAHPSKWAEAGTERFAYINLDLAKGSIPSTGNMLVQIHATIGRDDGGATALVDRAWRLRVRYQLGQRPSPRGAQTRSYFKSIQAWEKTAKHHLEPTEDVYPQPSDPDVPIFVSAGEDFVDLFPDGDEEPVIHIEDLPREEIHLRPAHGDTIWREKEIRPFSIPVGGLGDVLYYPQRSGIRDPQVAASLNLKLQCYVWILLPLHSDEGRPALFKETTFSFRDVRNRIQEANEERQRRWSSQRRRHKHE